MKMMSFTSSRDFRTWLAKNHSQSDGILLRIFKKEFGEKSITYSEALDQALCYGWIDGQKNAHDEHSWLQKFTPRQAKSSWSKKNTEHVARLIKSGQMARAGFEAVEAAKADGRWQTAYDSSRNAAPPSDFSGRVGQKQEGKAFLKHSTRQMFIRLCIAFNGKEA
jgi:uncharacterized protein YdeI (YjbR/CyaY-like superfamily)